MQAALNGGSAEKPERAEVLRTALEHARLSIELKGRRGIIEMRKHLCWYLQQIPGGKKLKQEAVKIESLDDVAALCALAAGKPQSATKTKEHEERTLL